MATEPIPVRATFSKPVSSVTVSFWDRPGTPTLLEAFDCDGKVVDRASLETVPNRKAPGSRRPHLPMTVRASRIADVQFSGPREGEYLAADEVRFTSIGGDFGIDPVGQAPRAAYRPFDRRCRIHWHDAFGIVIRFVAHEVFAFSISIQVISRGCSGWNWHSPVSYILGRRGADQESWACERRLPQPQW